MYTVVKSFYLTVYLTSTGTTVIPYSVQERDRGERTACISVQERKRSERDPTDRAGRLSWSKGVLREARLADNLPVGRGEDGMRESRRGLVMFLVRVEYRLCESVNHQQSYGVNAPCGRDLVRGDDELLERVCPAQNTVRGLDEPRRRERDGLCRRDQALRPAAVALVELLRRGRPLAVRNDLLLRRRGRPDEPPNGIGDAERSLQD